MHSLFVKLQASCANRFVWGLANAQQIKEVTMSIAKLYCTVCIRTQIKFKKKVLMSTITFNIPLHRWSRKYLGLLLCCTLLIEFPFSDGIENLRAPITTTYSQFPEPGYVHQQKKQPFRPTDTHVQSRQIKVLSSKLTHCMLPAH